ncbi:MAG: Mu transposase C-terminal domain-containing protein [Chloroflexota bacterium]
MGRIQLHVGMRLLLDEQIYLVQDLLEGGHCRLENLSFGGSLHLDTEQLATHWAEGRLRFEVSGRDARPAQTKGLTTAYTHADFDTLPAAQRESAWSRYRVLESLFRYLQQPRWIPLTRPQLQTFVEQHPEVQVSVFTLQRWLNAFLASGGDLRALLHHTDERGGKGKSRLHPDVEQIVQSTLASCQADPRHRTPEQVYAHLLNQIADENGYRAAIDRLEPPSRATFYRRLAQSGKATVLHRKPNRQQLHAVSAVEAGPRVTRLLERVEIDHTPLHLFVVDMDDRLPIGRPTLTMATDSYSKMPFGFDISFQPGSYLTVMRCLRHGILPKEDCQTRYGTVHPFPVYGLPETLVVDRGLEFVGTSLENALGMLGVIHEVMPGRTPWYKGGIERFFRTQNQGLLEGLPGYTFSNTFSRADYDPAQDACISLDTLRQMLHIFLLDIYAQRWHEGIEDIPMRRWNETHRSGLPPTFYHDADELRILLCASESRTLTRQGIAWETLHYNSPALAQLRLRSGIGQVRFRYDPDDLGEIYVFDPAQGWLTVPALHPEYAQGLSLYKHKVIRQQVLQDKRQSVDIQALAAARLHLQKLVSEEFSRTRSSRGRKRAARFLEGKPQPPVLPISVPASPLLAPPPFPAQKMEKEGWSGDYLLPTTRTERTTDDD